MGKWRYFLVEKEPICRKFVQNFVYLPVIQNLTVMIKYNLERIIMLRGYNKPVAFLQRCGYGYHKSHRMLTGKTQITFRELFELCTLLRCTPNDLMEWVPNPKHPLDDEHPLLALRRNNADEASLQALLKSVPADKVNEALELLGKLCKNDG